MSWGSYGSSPDDEFHSEFASVPDNEPGRSFSQVQSTSPSPYSRLSSWNESGYRHLSMPRTRSLPLGESWRRPSFWPRFPTPLFQPPQHQRFPLSNARSRHSSQDTHSPGLNPASQSTPVVGSQNQYGPTKVRKVEGPRLLGHTSSRSYFTINFIQNGIRPHMDVYTMRNRDEPVPFATYKLSSDVNLGVLIQSFVPQADEKTGITRVELVNGAWRDIGTYTPGLDVCELDLTQMGWPDLNQSAVWLCVYDLLQDEQDRREFADRHGFRTVSDLEAEKREEKLKMEEVDRVREIQLQEDLKRLEELRR